MKKFSTGTVTKAVNTCSARTMITVLMAEVHNLPLHDMAMDATNVDKDSTNNAMPDFLHTVIWLQQKQSRQDMRYLCDTAMIIGNKFNNPKIYDIRVYLLLFDTAILGLFTASTKKNRCSLLPSTSLICME